MDLIEDEDIRVLTALPVYNEESHVVSVLEEVRRYSQDILVVDDGSTDQTSEILKTVPGIDVITHRRNMGYGAGLRSAFDYAMAQKYDILVTIDCDGQHQPRLIPELAAAVFSDEIAPWDIISGSRYLKTFDGQTPPPEERRRINVEITQLLADCFDLHLTDSFCGFKAYRVEALHKFRITELGYAMPLQLWVQAVRNGMRVKEFPIPLIYLDEERSFGGSLDDSQIRLAYYKQVIQREVDALKMSCEEDQP